MPDLPADPAAVRALYERQWALLVPVADGLRAAATGPSPLVDDAWRGEAADAARRFLLDLRGELRLAADAVDDEAAVLRHQILDLA
jgi:hypothetical protein